MAGEMDKVRGRIKKAVGELAGNKKMKNDGIIDTLSGKVKSGVNKAKKILQGKSARYSSGVFVENYSLKWTADALDQSSPL